ncbi:MAG: cytochrome c3 family protein [Planctomycetota bacterium]
MNRISRAILERWSAFRAKSPSSLKNWAAFLLLNAVIGGYFFVGIFAPASSIKTAWLPGKTTHGHYQIEMDCDSCHSPVQDDSQHSATNVMKDACNRCHADQLKLAKDTHPAKKFNDPTNAVLLETLDAQDCLACHLEHVPDRTLSMGLTMPADYCWHCHQDVAESRPSHAGLLFDGCAVSGCHNYHDNRALYEKYLYDHFGEPDLRAVAKVPLRKTTETPSAGGNLTVDQGKRRPESGVGGVTDFEPDAPSDKLTDPKVKADWLSSAHARALVNCSDCHGGSEQQESASDRKGESDWSDSVAMDRCDACHEKQVATFVRGRHGMRMDHGRLTLPLSPMRPEMARLKMHAGKSHQELDCSACHAGHRFDTAFAAMQACVGCHADEHSLAYASSSHAQLWEMELSGQGEAGTGVSCATCHLPRMDGDDGTWVNHDQNAGLRPNETMARDVCANCHGLEYSLSALADAELSANCYSTPPSRRIESLQMAKDWFERKKAK